jgi:hypothetical protein
MAANSQTKLNDEEQLKHLKTVEWPRAYREQDTVLLDRILAEEFQFIDESGTVTTKRDELDYIKKHKPDYTSFVFTISRLEVFENGTAIVSGTGRVKGVDMEGRQYTYTYTSSNVLIKRAGQWKAIGSHVSGVKPE